MTNMVLGILGSPRRGGNSELLLDQAIAGAVSKGAQVEKLVVSELNISPCTSCDDCLSGGACVIHDDMDAVYPKLAQAEGFILAAPVYFLSLPAQTKAMIDRCQILWMLKYILGRPIAAKNEKRRGLFISVAHRDTPREFQPAIAVVKSFFATINVVYWRELLFGGIDRKGQIREHPTALEEALLAGAQLVSEGWVDQLRRRDSC